MRLTLAATKTNTDYNSFMLRLPQSPRKRRRLMRVAGALVVAGAIAAVAALLAGHGTRSPAASKNEGPAQMQAPVKKVRLTAADRKAIDAVLDRFLPAAMERRNPEVAWSLAGPELRASSTLAQWRKGSSPVPFYETDETSFHSWQVIDVEPNSVIFNLLVHPKPGSKLGTYAFSGEVIRRHGRWLVNRFYTIATLTSTPHKTRVVGPADFLAPPSSSAAAPAKPVVGHFGLLPVLGILALVLLIPAALGGVALVRARRFRRAARSGGRNTLPPLPASYLEGRDGHAAGSRD